MEGQEPTPLENPTLEASSSSTSPHIGDYGGGTQKPEGNYHDVFLNSSVKGWYFCNHLHNSLVNAGIDTLRITDRSNEEFLKSLTQCKISIPIISPDYTSSESCLRELVHMLRCKRSSGQIVLPIFYWATSSEVQRVEGNIKLRFSRHEGRVDETELGEWRKALEEVGSLRGWESDKFDHYGITEALLKLVVARVVSLLKRTFKLPKELVGTEDQVTDIMRSVDPKYNDTRIIGIYGVRGSGKTTLAKILWNNFSGDFEHLSFVPNIREVSQHMDIEYLQEELICGILRSSHTVSNVDEGIGIMKSQFASKKILIILDDVDNETHLDALFGDGSWLKAGSIVIVTTRNMSTLMKANAYPKHQLKEWTQDQALTLFSRHLFGNDSPPEGYEITSRRVVSGIPRIPLILEHVGSSFRRKRETAWDDAFRKLGDDVTNKKDRYVLRITYESLDYKQQEIFLDIACFFIGSSSQNLIYMWDSCGFLPKKGIDVLRDMSLIEIDKDDKLIMHDDIRDFGRRIIYPKDEDDEGIQKFNRLWNYEEALDVLANNKGTNMIQAICLDKYDSNRSYTG